MAKLSKSGKKLLKAVKGDRQLFQTIQAIRVAEAHGNTGTAKALRKIATGQARRVGVKMTDALKAAKRLTHLDIFGGAARNPRTRAAGSLAIGVGLGVVAIGFVWGVIGRVKGL